MAPSLILDNLCPKLETGKEITRALVGEFTGTFVLVLIINTISAQQTLSRPNQDLFVIAHLGAGLAVAFGVAIAAKISGGHINPAVTITMLTLQQIKTVKAILYILAQLAGAFVGAAVAYLFYHDTINYFDSGTRHVTGTQATAQIFASYLTPHLSICGGLVSQIIGTAVFVFFIIHFVDRRNSYPNWIQPFITGLVFLMIGTVFSSDTKYSLNPARDLGPRLFTCIIGYGIETFSFRDYNWFWVPLLGPILGGVVGGHLYQLFIEFYAPSENRSDIAFTDEYQPIVERVSSRPKRKDIQWLRALAISVVFIFHLVPKYCPQGYLGVDVFFVISGYLMTKILYSSKTSSFIEATIIFYNKRMKRLFPAYFAAILLTVITGSFIILDIDYGFLIKDAIWSSLFVSNLPPMLEEKSYFELTSQFKFLLHTWSLSVEVQYYLIAPLLCFVLHRTYGLYFFLLISFFSLLLQWIVRGTTMEFDLLFCRLWQFLVGTVVFLLAKNYKDTLKSTESVSKKFRTLFSGAALLLISLCIMPEISILAEYKFAVRFLATVLGGVIVYSGHYDQLPIPRTVDTFLTYLGDISYSFYLIHWPVILLGRYSYTDSTMSGLIAIVLICIIGSVLLYEFLDKVIPTKTTFVVFIQTGIVFTIIMMLCFNSFSLHSDILRQKFELHKDADANLSMKEIIKINEKFVLSCNKLPISNCHSDPTMNRIFSEFKHSINWVHSCAVDLHPNGTKTVALLGNSFAARFSVTAIEALKEFPSVRKMYLISRPDCTMFDTLNNGALRRWHCEEMVGQNIAFAREIRPDIIIHVAAYHDIPEPNISADGLASLENDTINLGIKREISEYEKYTKKIILFEPSPFIYNLTLKVPQEIARLLAFNYSLTALTSLDLLRDFNKKRVNDDWMRIQLGSTDCRKCLVIPTFDLFCGKTRCPMAEPSGLSRYCNQNHLSEAGTNLMLPSLKNVLKKVL